MLHELALNVCLLCNVTVLCVLLIIMMISGPCHSSSDIMHLFLVAEHVACLQCLSFKFIAWQNFASKVHVFDGVLVCSHLIELFLFIRLLTVYCLIFRYIVQVVKIITAGHRTSVCILQFYSDAMS